MTTSSSDPTVTAARRAGRILSTVFCAGCLALAALMVVPGLVGYERYVITSGSMAGSYPRGSLVFDEVVPVSELGLGDAITYTPPPGAGPTGPVTHRIVWIGVDQFDRPVFRTKGDANEAPDPWTFALDEPRQARVAFHVPYVGYVYSALAVREIRMLVIGFPAIVLALALVIRVRREAQQAYAPVPAARPSGGSPR